MKPQPRYQPGDKIGGRYQVHQVKMGGMGEVYLCLDLESNLPYALKTFQQRYLTSSAKLRAAFENEVATWVALEKHPNIVRCFLMDIFDNQPFMFLEWIVGDENRGTDLRSWLQYGPLGLRSALDFTIDICRGLIHAQEKQPGLVHRDLKPENILVAQDRLVKITDFGLAQIIQTVGLEIKMAVEDEIHRRQSLIGQGGIVGTPHYMSPEQWLSEPLDARADIYAVGCILYEMLTGSWPFKATTINGFQRQHLRADIPRLADDQTGISALNTLLINCLAKRREDRFASAYDLLQQLTLIYHQEFAELPRTVPVSDEFTAIDYTLRGATYDQLRQYDKALSDYNQSIQLDPNWAPAYGNRGLTYFNLQQPDKSLADLDRAIQLDPADARAYYNRGTAYDYLQRYEEAIANYSKAIQLDSYYARAYTNRGNIYDTFGRYKEALTDFNRALDLNPTDAITYRDRGLTYSNLQRYEEALDDLGRAIQLHPAEVKAYFYRGNVHAAIQQYDQALADYNRAIQLEPGFAPGYFNRGNTHAALRQYEEAIADYDRVIELDPYNGVVHINKGAILSSLDRWHEALYHFEKAAQLGQPQAAHYATKARQRLETESTRQVDSAQIAFESFQEVGSVAEMKDAVVKFPFMIDADFIAAIEQAIVEQVPPEHRPFFEQRLAWLRQIAREQQ